jgi:hypothetical protein
MSVDIASLRIEIDATPADKAQKSLELLTAAAERLDAAARRVRGSTEVLNRSHERTTDGTKSAASGVLSYAAAQGALERATRGVMSASQIEASLFARNQALRASLVVQEVADAQRAAKATAAARLEATRTEDTLLKRNAALRVSMLAEEAKASATAAKIQATAVSDLERRIFALKSSIDPTYAAQQRLDAEMKEAASLYRMGAISASDYATATRMLDARLAAVTRGQALAASGSKLHAHELLNLSRQFSDIGVTAAMGMNPLMILIQQGPQIGETFVAASQRGLTFSAVMKEMAVAGWAMLAPFAPLIAAGAALTAGFYALSAAMKASQTTSDNALKAARDFATVMANAEDAIKGVTQATFKLADARKEAARAALEQLRIDNQAEIRRLENPSLLTRAGRVLGGAPGAMADRADLEQANRLRAENATLMAEGVRLVMSSKLAVEGEAKAHHQTARAAHEHARATRASAEATNEAQREAQDFLANLRQETAELGLSSDEIKVRNGYLQAMIALAQGYPDLSAQIMTETDAWKALSDRLKGVQELVQAGEARAAAIAGAPAAGGFDVEGANAYLEVLREIDSQAQRSADSLGKAFGPVGQALGDLTAVLSHYEVAQQANATAHLERLSKLEKGTRAYHDEEARGARDAARTQVGAYGDLASAAKDFFDERSDGYAALQRAETAFRLLEFAMSARAVVVAAAESSAKVGFHAAETASGIAAGAANIFASLGPFAFPVVAAMLAVMAGLGAKTGGAASAPGAHDMADRQAAQGAGSVLGDSSAKSQSLQNALKSATSNWNKDLEYASSMVRSLRSIDSQIGQLAAAVARSLSATGALSTSNLDLGSSVSGGSLLAKGVGAVGGGLIGGGLGIAGGMAAGGLLGSAGGVLGGLGAGLSLGSILGPVGAVLGALLGPMLFSVKQTRTLQDQGLQFDPQSLGAILSGGISGQSYAQILTETKKTFLGLTYSDKTSSSTQTAALDADLADQITRLIGSLKSGVLSAAGVLGVTGAEATLDAFTVNLGKLSFKDMSGAEIQDALNAVFGKLADDLAAAIIPGVTALQKVGEGAFETLTRLAREYQVVDVGLASIGMSFNSVGVASVGARDRLVELVGGMDEFVSQTSFFAENYLSDAERIAPVQKAVSAELARLGVSGVATKEAFKQLVLGLDVSTDSGAETYAALMALAPAFLKVADYADSAAQAARELEAQGVKAANDNVASATQALIQARDQEVSALQANVEKFRSAAEALRSYRKDLDLGAAGNLSPSARYTSARAEFQRISAAARTGDTTALGGLQQAGQAYLEASKAYVATSQDYFRDLAEVKSGVTAAADFADTQVDIGTQQLEALNASVNGLGSVKDSVLSVRDAIADLTAAIRVQASVAAGRSLGANPEVNAQLAAKTGYGGDFGKGGFQAWIVDQPESVKTLARGILHDAGQDYRIGFATGGSFKVGGAGGPDSQRVNLNLSPGEIVNVRRPGNDNDLAGELRALRAEMTEMRAEQARHLSSIANATDRTRRLQERWEGGGMPPAREAVA